MTFKKQIMRKEMKLPIIQVLKSSLCDYNNAYILVRGVLPS